MIGVGPSLGRFRRAPGGLFLAPGSPAFSFIRATTADSFANVGSTGSTHDLVTKTGTPVFKASGGPGGIPSIMFEGNERLASARPASEGVAEGVYPFPATGLSVFVIAKVADVTKLSIIFQTDGFLIYMTPDGLYHCYYDGFANIELPISASGGWDVIEAVHEPDEDPGVFVTRVSVNGTNVTPFQQTVGHASRKLTLGNDTGIGGNAASNIEIAECHGWGHDIDAAVLTPMRARYTGLGLAA